MPKAIWNGAVLAESDQTIVVEGNHYFPPESIHKEYFNATPTHSLCPWKGTASYYSISVNGQTNRDAAWFYASPKATPSQSKDYVAFWRRAQRRPSPPPTRNRHTSTAPP